MSVDTSHWTSDGYTRALGIPANQFKFNQEAASVLKAGFLWTKCEQNKHSYFASVQERQGLEYADKIHHTHHEDSRDPETYATTQHAEKTKKRILIIIIIFIFHSLQTLTCFIRPQNEQTAIHRHRQPPYMLLPSPVASGRCWTGFRLQACFREAVFKESLKAPSPIHLWASFILFIYVAPL